MGDLIDRQAAIDAINKAFERVFTWDGTSPLGDKVLENVPSAQPEERTEKRTDAFALPEIIVLNEYDTIESEDGRTGFGVYVPEEKKIYVAGDVPQEMKLKALFHELAHWVQDVSGIDFDEDTANELSEIIYDAVVPEETHDKRTETHACDCISRQAAIDAFLTELTKRERKNLLHTWSTVEVKYFITKMLEQMPPAQPEIIQCKDCKHWDGVDTCDVIDAPVWDDDFCSMAERRSDG